MVKGFTYSLLSTICFALPTVFLVFAYEDGLTPQSLGVYQSIAGTLFIFVYIKLTGEKLPKLTRSNMIDFFIVGVIGKGGSTISTFFAIQYMDVSLVMPIVFMYPVVVILLEFFIDRKKMTFIQSAGIVVIFIGEILAMKIYQGDFHTLSIKAVVFSLISCLTFGWMLYWINKKLGAYSPIVVTGYTTLFCTICLLIFMGPFVFLETKFTLSLILWSLFFGLTISTLANLFLYVSIKYIGAARSSIISILELPFTLIFAFIFLQERMNLIQVMGVSLIFLGIIFFELKNFRYFIPTHNLLLIQSKSKNKKMTKSQ